MGNPRRVAIMTRTLQNQMKAKSCDNEYEEQDATMQNAQSLTQQILRLSPEQRAVVEEFINSLQQQDTPRPTFREALDRFKREHPELLRLLAQ